MVVKIWFAFPFGCKAMDMSQLLNDFVLEASNVQKLFAHYKYLSSIVFKFYLSISVARIFSIMAFWIRSKDCQTDGQKMSGV